MQLRTHPGGRQAGRQAGARARTHTHTHTMGAAPASPGGGAGFSPIGTGLPMISGWYPATSKLMAMYTLQVHAHACMLSKGGDCIIHEQHSGSFYILKQSTGCYMRPGCSQEMKTCNMSCECAMHKVGQFDV
eukprot:1160115-Pelagomonas_calceolata.AAC.1